MPRAKVPLEDRQRSVIACLPCKRAKIRCDSETPCATCRKRGREDACIYQEPSTRVHRRRHSQLSSDTSVRDHGVHSVSKRTSTGPTPDSTANGPPSSTNEETEGPQSRLLLSSKLQKVYIGETGSLSYLQFIRRIMKHRIGPCAFTEGEFNMFMLENEVATTNSETLDPMDFAEKQTLAQWYLDATSGILDLHSKIEVLSSLNSANPAIGLPATYLILAIGAQCRGTSPTDLQHSSSYFSKGQQLAFEGMLCDPSVDMARNFLLMAFYMLGACHRNAAFMYLGVATKAASALGLHRADQYRDLPADECRARLGTWKSLRVLDTIANAILGRSCSLPGMLQPEHQLDDVCRKSNDATGSPRAMALQSIFDICPFMDELETSRCRKDMASAEDFLQRLQKWSKALPEELRTSTDPNMMTTALVDRELYIAGTHVACVYYFAVILTTRKFLTLHLLDQLRERNTTDQTHQKSQKEDKTSSLGYVCLNAAVNLAKVGHNAMASNQMLNNMCLLKAWMFAAGLILGFSMFAQGSGTGNDTEVAFHQTREVLKKLAELSLQAGHYYELLTQQLDAITLSQRRLAEERKRVTSQYLDQIFTSNPNEPIKDPTNMTGFGSSEIPMLGDDILASGQGLDPNGFALDNITPGPHGLMISEGFPWPADDLSFDWQAMAPYFDNVL